MLDARLAVCVAIDPSLCGTAHQVYRVKDNVTYSVVIEEYDAENGRGWKPYTAEDVQVRRKTLCQTINQSCIGVTYETNDIRKLCCAMRSRVLTWLAMMMIMTKTT